jgi:hypothetical protein
MKVKSIAVCCLCLISFVAFARDGGWFGGGHSSYHSRGTGEHEVHGYTRSNGAYVRGHQQTDPNGTKDRGGFGGEHSSYDSRRTDEHDVRGYPRSDGTYVSGHQQTNPNGTKYDNWSSKGNVNPYTGKVGMDDPSR